VKNYDVIIIGGGHNGLAAACYLAKAGLQILLAERREQLGGIAVTEEISSGFRCSTISHSAGPFLPQVARDLDLERYGLEFIRPGVRVTALHPSEDSILIYEEAKQTATGFKKFSTHDADNYAEFTRVFSQIGKVLEPLLTMTPPAVDHPSAGELWDLGKLGLAFRGLGRKDSYRLLRWGPMAVADLVAEWFENERVRAAIAARGIFGAFAGPWSAGTSLGLLWQSALDQTALSPASFVKGGMGALSDALAQAAKEAGVEIRVATEAASITVKDNQTSGVVFTNGEEALANTVLSSVDPRTTFLNLMDPLNLDPNFILKIRNYRSVGAVAKVNLALSRLPRFLGVKDAALELSGRVHIGPDIDYLERAFDAAKYGELSTKPYLDITLPSLTDTTLAPKGAHVMSVHVQFAPYKLRVGDWQMAKGPLAETVVNALTEYAPDLPDAIVGQQVITPIDLEQEYGLSGGHIMHGEQSLDQFFAFRPLIGWAQYRSPIRGLYLCGAGTHPGGGVTGGPAMNASREVLKDLKRR